MIKTGSIFDLAGVIFHMFSATHQNPSKGGGQKKKVVTLLQPR